MQQKGWVSYWAHVLLWGGLQIVMNKFSCKILNENLKWFRPIFTLKKNSTLILE